MEVAKIADGVFIHLNPGVDERQLKLPTCAASRFAGSIIQGE